MQEIKTAFSGNVPANYHQRLVPLIFADYAKDLARRVRVRPGSKLLETACGTGVVTRELRNRLPESVGIVATDLSEPMLAAAREQLPEAVVLQQADAMALPFDDETFAAVVCQFGAMFFPDKVMGFAEALRVLEPGGQLLFSTWDRFELNPLPGIAGEVSRQFMPQNTPPFMAAPFSYHDPQVIREELSLAGFENTQIEMLLGTARAASAKKAALAMVLGSPLGLELAQLGKQQECLDAIEQAVIRHFGDGAIAAPMQALLVTASKPQ